MLTDAWRRLLFSSCNCLTRILYVSSSTFKTLLCWFKLSMRFCNCSRDTGDGGAIELLKAAPSREHSDSDCEQGELLSMASALTSCKFSINEIGLGTKSCHQWCDAIRAYQRILIVGLIRTTKGKKKTHQNEEENFATSRRSRSRNFMRLVNAKLDFKYWLAAYDSEKRC